MSCMKGTRFSYLIVALSTRYVTHVESTNSLEITGIVSGETTVIGELTNTRPHALCRQILPSVPYESRCQHGPFNGLPPGVPATRGKGPHKP